MESRVRAKNSRKSTPPKGRVVARTNAKNAGPLHSPKFRDLLAIAQQSGLLAGVRTKTVRARMPDALVARAKARTGIESDTDLIELALASLAVADDYPDWLLSQRTTVDRNVDLEF
jgi:hypothetical protein